MLAQHIVSSAVTGVLTLTLLTLQAAPCFGEPSQRLHARRHADPKTLLPILPNSYGFGTRTVAGSGRHLIPPRTKLIRVQTLADSGPGSLRACATANQPRTCIFEVSGVIPLRSIVRIRHPYLTIAGHTAPKPGITITGAGLSIETHDVLVQHLAIRPGDNPSVGAPAQYRDGVSIGAPPPHQTFNVVLDHLSVSWAIDENIATGYRKTHSVTVANSLIAEGLNNSIHPKGSHSKGIMVGNESERITLYRNVLTANEERNPYIKPGASVEMVNNLVYGWGPKGGWSLCNISNNDGEHNPIALTFIGNVYLPGPWSFITPPLYARVLSPSSKIYVEDNLLLTNAGHLSGPWSITNIDEETFRAEHPPLQSGELKPLESNRLHDVLLQTVGSRPAKRDGIDRRIISDIRTRQGSLKDCLRGCRNAASPVKVYTQRRRKLTPPRDLFSDANGDGYTNLENWLHRIEKRVLIQEKATIS